MASFNVLAKMYFRQEPDYEKRLPRSSKNAVVEFIARLRTSDSEVTTKLDFMQFLSFITHATPQTLPASFVCADVFQIGTLPTYIFYWREENSTFGLDN